MSVHLNEIKGIVNLLNQMNSGLNDEQHALLIPVSLSDSWATVSSSLGSSTTNGKLTVKSVTTVLLDGGNCTASARRRCGACIEETTTA